MCYFIEAGVILYRGRRATLYGVCYFIEAGVILYKGRCATLLRVCDTL